MTLRQTTRVPHFGIGRLLVHQLIVKDYVHVRLGVRALLQPNSLFHSLGSPSEIAVQRFSDVELCSSAAFGLATHTDDGGDFGLN